MFSPRLLLCVAVLLAFGSSVTHGFHFDDFAVLHGTHWDAWQTRPLTWLSFEVNSRLGAHPALWHLFNLTAHLGTVLLLYEFLLNVCPAGAFAGAAVFAVHPIQAEAVAYVYARATLLSTLFSVSALLLWTRNRRWWAVGCFALALLAKEDCVTLPFAILLISGWRRWRELAKPLVTMLAMAGLAGAHVLLATRFIPNSGAGFSAGISWYQYLFDQGFVIIRYLWLFVIPYGFSIDPQITVSVAGAVASWVLIGFFLAIARYWRGGVWFTAGLILLIPSSSVFPAADLAADHRMYLPMIGFAAAIGVLLAGLQRWTTIGVVIALIFLSAVRMNVWATDEALWSEAMNRAPQKLRPEIQLARALDSKRALALLTQAKVEHPGNPDVENELGRVYLQMGRPQDALAEFGEVLAQRPEDAHAFNNRGIALRALGQAAPAEQDFHRALTIEPCLEEARRNLGMAACGR